MTGENQDRRWRWIDTSFVYEVMEISRQFLFNYWNFCNKISRLSEDKNDEDEKQRIRHEYYEMSHQQAMKPVYWIRYYFMKEIMQTDFIFITYLRFFTLGTLVQNKYKCNGMLCNIGPLLWQWMLENLFTDEANWGNKNAVL